MFPRVAALAVVVACSSAATPLSAQCVGDACRPAPHSTSVLATHSTTRAGQPVELLWPAPPTYETVVEHPYLHRGHDLGLISVGVTLLSVGTALGLVLGLCDSLALANSTGDGWTFGFIPFAGGILSITATLEGTRSRSSVLMIGAPFGTLAQVIGVIALMVAVHGHTEEVAPSVSIAGMRLHVMPYASGSDAGLVAGLGW